MGDRCYKVNIFHDDGFSLICCPRCHKLGGLQQGQVVVTDEKVSITFTCRYDVNREDEPMELTIKKFTDTETHCSTHIEWSH